MEEGRGQGGYDWRDNYLRGMLERTSTKRNFHTMAEGHHSQTSIDLHTNTTSDNSASGSERDGVVSRERPPFEVHPYGRQNRRDHAHDHTHTHTHTHITGRASSPVFVPRDMPLQSQRNLNTPHHASQRSSTTGMPHRRQLALPRPDTRGTSEVANSRYPGDGLDFRRPIMSNGEARTRQSQIVDLTGDENLNAEPGGQTTAAMVPGGSSDAWRSSRRQGLPRFGRDIIDVEVEADDLIDMTTNHDTAWTEHHAPGDGDDLVIIETRPRRTHRPQSRRPTPAQSRSITPHLANLDDPIDLTNDQDEVIITDTRRLAVADDNGGHVQRPVLTAGYGTRAMNGHVEHIANILREQPRLMNRFEAMGVGLGRIMPTLAHDHGRRDHDHHHHHHHHQLYARVGDSRGRNRLWHPPRTGAADVPSVMDYETAGFDLGLADTYRPPTPKYSPPPPVPAGFTGSPGEDETVVCPNCGDELVVGGGKWVGDASDEMKQQIWVLKKCGHAYCGACATRKAASGAKGKGKGKEKAVDDGAPPPLRKCVVDGCGQPASKSSLIHVYLSQ